MGQDGAVSQWLLLVLVVWGLWGVVSLRVEQWWLAVLLSFAALGRAQLRLESEVVQAHRPEVSLGELMRTPAVLSSFATKGSDMDGARIFIGMLKSSWLACLASVSR